MFNLLRTIGERIDPEFWTFGARVPFWIGGCVTGLIALGAAVSIVGGS